MATRFYFINGSVILAPTTIRGGWEITDNFNTIPLSTVKTGGAIVVKSNSEGSSAVPNDVLMLRAVSGALAAQTIAGDLSVVLGVKAPYFESRYFWHIHVYVTQGNTDLVRGTLSDNYRESGSINYWPDAAQTRNTILNVPLSTLAIQAGDKIVVEIGYISRQDPQFALRLIATKKQAGPVSAVNLTFTGPPFVGNGLIVMVAGHKDSGGMAFNSCVDNRGNTYSIAVPPRHISGSGTFAITIYYCAKIITTGDPFTITITGDGSDHAFVAVAYEWTGLRGGLLTLAAISSATPATPSTVPDTGGAGDLAGPLVAGALFARFLSAASIGVHTENMNWAQTIEELNTVWNISICSEIDLAFSNTTAIVPLRATWITDVASTYAAAMAAFKRTSEVLGTGDLYYGAPVGSTDLVHPDPDVDTQVGSIEFTQTILLDGELTSVGHIVTQVAELIPLPPAHISHEVVQVASFAPPRLNISHVVAQVAHPHPGAPTSLSHLVVQVADLPPISDARISHSVIQVVPTVRSVLDDISGLYFLNPSKAEYHDSYYRNTELKIPNPTIKTAFVGE